MRTRYLSFLLVASACQAPTADPSATPEEAFTALENRLLAAAHVEVEFEIIAEGAYEVDLRGLLIARGPYVYLVAQGMFAGQPTRVELVSTEHELRGGADVGHILGPRPSALEEGILLGLTRMGLLHNLAVLSQNQAPEGVDGEMRSWVQVDDVGIGVDGSLGFDLIVAGENTGHAKLAFDEGVPSLREQVVQFPSGKMQVVERYSRFIVRDR